MFIEKLHHKAKLLLLLVSSNVVNYEKATDEVNFIVQEKCLISEALLEVKINTVAYKIVHLTLGKLRIKTVKLGCFHRNRIIMTRGWWQIRDTYCQPMCVW